MMAINLGTRGIDAARNLVEYCNHPEGSYWSDLRKSHGKKEPYNIKLWCLGNEMDGPWQVGQKTADEYGRIASETAKSIKLFDPELEVVACGSSSGQMPTFPDWESTVLDHCYDYVDYISLHQYFSNADNDIETYLGESVAMDEFIKTVASTCDFIKSKKRSKKKMYLSFDEWNVWFHSAESDKKLDPWTKGPAQLEDIYTFEDALVVGCALNTLVKNVDRVKIACLAQLVNVIAPIMTENGGDVWCQTIYWPYYYVSKFGRGTSMDLRVDVPCYKNKKHGLIPFLDIAVILSEDEKYITYFIVSRHQVEQIILDSEVLGFGELIMTEWVELTNKDLKAVNSKNNPNNVKPVKNNVSESKQSFKIKPLSWSMVRFEIA